MIKKRGLLNFLASIVGCLLLIGGGMLANADALTLTLDDGLGNVVELEDGDPTLDKNPLTGVVTFLGAVGSWFLNVSTGVSDPVIGTPSAPELDLNSINTTAGDGGTLTITLSDWFNSALVPDGFNIFWGGTTTGTSVEFWSDISDNSGIIASTGIFTEYPTSFSGSTVFLFDLGLNPEVEYELSLNAVITHSAGGNTSFDIGATPVPEPATIMLVGAGLVGLGGFARRQLKKS